MEFFTDHWPSQLNQYITKIVVTTDWWTWEERNIILFTQSVYSSARTVTFKLITVGFTPTPQRRALWLDGTANSWPDCEISISTVVTPLCSTPVQSRSPECQCQCRTTQPFLCSDLSVCNHRSIRISWPRIDLTYYRAHNNLLVSSLLQTLSNPLHLILYSHRKILCT